MATVAQPVATDIDTLCINTIRTLSIDAIQKANSGHPGTPMAMAPVAYTLWQRFLRFDPAVSLDDIKSFRQLDSHAAGHPEYHLTSGVEATTGPLGQGIATSVGMAIAGKWLQARYGSQVYDFDTYDVYVICGDGDLMEGVS